MQEAYDKLEQTSCLLDEEKQRSETLLYQMLPSNIANVLRAGHKVPAAEHANVTVLFSDIVGFTVISKSSSPMEVTSMLDNLCEWWWWWSGEEEEEERGAGVLTGGRMPFAFGEAF